MSNNKKEKNLSVREAGVTDLISPPTSGLIDQFRGFESLGSMHDRYRGVGPGFDFLRLFLAIIIFYAHTNIVLKHVGPMPTGIEDVLGLNIVGPKVTESLYGYFLQIKSRVYIIYVPMFFALSGYLVAGSAFRTRKVIPFLRLRAMRIFPALVVEVLLSTVLLGLLFTQLPLGEYFSHPQFWRYMGNMVGYVSFNLPGVFENNPGVTLVNANLWTLPAEFYSYLVLGGLIATGIVFRPFVLTVLFVGLTIGMIVASLTTGFGLKPGVYSVFAVLYYFLFGLMFFIHRRYVPMNALVFVVFGVVILNSLQDVRFTFFLPLLVTYITIYIGYIPQLALKFMRGRDYSYGIYLYGFPITQAVVAVNPEIGRLPLFALALLLTLVFAALSWHWIEKPILKRK